MNKKLWFVVVIGLIGVSYLMLSNGQKKNCAVTADEVKEKLDEGMDMIDVRTPQEYASGHVKGAKLIDINSSDFKKQISLLDKNKSYYVYCKAGARSSKAQKIMMEMGFTNVCNVEGGIVSLQKEGVKLVN